MTKKHKEKSRTVRHLIQSTARGNINSSYQLYLNYSKGKNVEEKNDELAQNYFEEVEKALIE